MTKLGSLSIHDLRCGLTTTKSDALEFSKPDVHDGLLTEPMDTEHHSQKCLQGVAGEMSLLDGLLTEPTDTEHHSQKGLQGVAGEMFLPALAETIGLVLDNHVVAHRHL